MIGHRTGLLEERGQEHFYLMLGLNSEILAHDPSLLKQGIAGRKGGESTEVAIRCPQFLNTMMLAGRQCGHHG